MDDTALAGLWAFLIAGLAGASELMVRYRDDPLRAVRSLSASIYVALNGGTGAAAAYLLPKFTHGRYDVVTLSLAAGFGALAVMRLSIVKLKVGGDDVSVGPALVLEQVLKVVDRGVDRHLAEHRSEIATLLSRRLDFATQSAALVALCIALLQNASSDEQLRLTDVVRALSGRNDIPSDAKSVSLLLALLAVVGERVLVKAMDHVCGPDRAQRS